MPWKMNGDHAEVQDGHPVWVYDDGKEAPFDAGSALSKIRDLTSESIGRKNKLKDMEQRFAPVAEIEDLATYITNANKALETVANFKDKDFIEAGEVERLKHGVAESFETKISELTKSYDKKIKAMEEAESLNKQNIQKLLVRGAFDRSEFIRENTILSPRIVYSTFAKNFQIEDVDGTPTAIGTRENGEKIFSLKKPGSYADTEEALEILINEHPDKDIILKGTPGGGGTLPGGHQKRNVDVLKMSPRQRLDASRGL